MLIEAYAQRFVQKVAGMVALTATSLGSLRVAQVEGESDEATAAGLRFWLSLRGGTGIAPVQANPTTAAQWMLFNPLGNTVTAFVDQVSMDLASGVAGAGGSLIACIVPPSFAPATIPTVSAATTVIANANPTSGKTSKLICVASQTLQNAVASNWIPIGQMRTIGTVLGQTQIVGDDLKGRIAIPPGCGLALAVISPTGTTPLWTPVATWREYAADTQ